MRRTSLSQAIYMCEICASQGDAESVQILLTPCAIVAKLEGPGNNNAASASGLKHQSDDEPCMPVSAKAAKLNW